MTVEVICGWLRINLSREMRKLLAAYYSISGSRRSIGRGNETTAVPSSEHLNPLLRKLFTLLSLLYTCKCISAFKLETYSDTTCKFTVFKTTSNKDKMKGGIFEGRGVEGFILKRKRREQMFWNILG